MTSKSTSDDRDDDIMSIFELFDPDVTGTISFEHVQNVAKIIGAKDTSEDIQNMLSTLDNDADGELDPIDFYTCVVSGMRIRMEQETRARIPQAEQLNARIQDSQTGT